MSTYKKNYNKKPKTDTHGLDFLELAQVKCLRVGAFPPFHDSFSSSPEIYLRERKFGWEELVNLPTRKFDMEIDFSKSKIKERIQFNIDGIIMDELTREMLFMYAMSMLARYQPVYWTEIHDKKEYGWKIVDYMRTTQSLFPNIIFNQLHGEKYEFYPEARLMLDKENYESPF